MAEETQKSAVVMIPTYNEADNIAELIGEILELPVETALSVLVADDDSPDGTGRIVEELARKDRHVHALIRKKRRGRGAGGIDGFKAALALRTDFVIEMDGDFSHSPRFIPDLIAAMDRYDVVLGSRFVKGGKDSDRNLIRRFITLLARLFIKRLFRIPVKDASSGFRCFRREVLESLHLDESISVGPSIVLETLYKAFRHGYGIGEIPIVFMDRRGGRTKLGPLILLKTLIMALKIRRRYRPAPCSY